MKEQLLSTLEISKNYTLSVAEAMPEDSYNFKLQNAVWSFKELLHHIAYGIKWWEENYIKKMQTDWQPPMIDGGKKSIIKQLDAAYESLKTTISNSKMDDEIVHGFQATLDHITHHRGQAVLHLRCKGITPPEYTF